MVLFLLNDPDVIGWFVHHVAQKFAGLLEVLDGVQTVEVILQEAVVVERMVNCVIHNAEIVINNSVFILNTLKARGTTNSFSRTIAY